MKCRGINVNPLQLGKVAIQNTDDLTELRSCVSLHHCLHVRHITHRVFGLCALAQCARNVVDLLDHLGEVSGLLVQLLGKLLGKLVGSLAFLVRTGQLFARAKLLGKHFLNLRLVSVEPGLQLVLLALNSGKLALDFMAGPFGLESIQIELLDLLSVVHQVPVPGRNCRSLLLELLLILGQVRGPSCHNVFHRLVLKSCHLRSGASGRSAQDVGGAVLSRRLFAFLLFALGRIVCRSLSTEHAGSWCRC